MITIGEAEELEKMEAIAINQLFDASEEMASLYISDAIISFGELLKKEYRGITTLSADARYRSFIIMLINKLESNVREAVMHSVIFPEYKIDKEFLKELV